MKISRLALPLVLLAAITVTATAWAKQLASDDNNPVRSEAAVPRAPNGKKLLTSLDLMKIANVGSPRISPDATRVAYTVGEESKLKRTRSGKQSADLGRNNGRGDRETGRREEVGRQARQYTQGEKSATAPEWSPTEQCWPFSLIAKRMASVKFG